MGVLKVENLEFGFRHRSLFKDLTFTLNPGELLHLSGPNGAGKSTLMAIIAGLIAPKKGQISVISAMGGEPSDDRRLELEYLPAEANGLFLKMSARQNLRFWSTLRGQTCSDEQLDNALATWGLNKPLWRDNFAVEKFSTGMKRRLALARLLLSPAPCWLLDEPFYGLDQEATVTFQQQLSAHLQDGGSALLVSHELGPLGSFATRSLTLSEPRPALAGAKGPM